MSPLDSPATVLTNVPIDVTDKIERTFTWIGESEWDNRRARPLKRFRWSELRSVSRILPIRPRLPHGTFVGDVKGWLSVPVSRISDAVEDPSTPMMWGGLM